VMAKVESFTEYCVNVTLVEYSGLSGALQFSELSNKRLRQAPHKILLVGKLEPLQVLKVDEQKGYIDLSRKGLTNEEKKACEDKFNKSKTVHSIISHLSTQFHCSMEDLFKTIVWPLSKHEEYSHPFDLFQASICIPELLDSLKISANVKNVLIQLINRRLGSHQVKVQATVEVTCFTHEGIEAIVPALQAGENVGGSTDPIKIAVVATPLYSISTHIKASEKAQGIELLQKSIREIKKEIEKRSGTLVVKVAPNVTAA